MENRLNMDTKHLIGQKLVAGFAGQQMPEDFKQKVAEYKIGNVILFANNVQNEVQLTRLCREIHDYVLEQTGQIPFLTIDQEGGCVTRLSEDFAVVPGAMQISGTGDPHKAYLAGRITAAELRRCGVNFDLAPVADVNSNPQNPVIGVRSYGDTPQQTADYAVQMAKGLMDGGVLACAKHFPGHGDTAVDSHIGLPMVDKSLPQLKACELVPFRALIDSGISGIMTTHILFPQLEPDGLPATMSRRILTDLLRGELGFEGLILSDCMMMGAIAQHYGTVEGGVKAFAAGVDLVFTSHDIHLSCHIAERMYQKLEQGEIDRAAIEESTARILRYKQWLTQQPAAPVTDGKAQADEMYRQSLAALHAPVTLQNPIAIACHPFVTTLASSPQNKDINFARSLGESLGCDYIVNGIEPDEAEIAAIVARARQHGSIVFASYNGHVKQAQCRLGKALAQLGLPMVWAAMRNPYDLKDLPKEVYGICAFEYTGRSIQAVTDVLQGRLVPQGRLSVTL